MNTIAGMRLNAMTLGMLASALVQAQATVGRTAGEAAATAIGAARYTIPLALPPGTNGLAPDLAVTYDSRSGNGPLGVGFRLSGFSAIRRCNSTLAQDGRLAAVLLYPGDRLCLDGQRLRLTAGIYGQAGSQYQTEIEIFSRVTAIGTAGDGPASFRVESRDGLIYEYGATTDSRIEGGYGSTTAREWALNRIRDRDGNYVDFKYVEDTANGSYRPLRIDYAGNTATAAVPYYSVRFAYESRPAGDVPVRYVAADAIREPYRLDRIDVVHIATGRSVRSYDIAYATPGPTGSSRIGSLQECAGAECLAATTFAWSSTQPGWGADMQVNLTAEQHAAAIPGDMNGDGFDDVAYFDAVLRHWRILYGTAQGFQGSAVDTGLGADGDPGRALSADIDGNGKRDVLVLGAGNYWYWLRHTGANAYAYASTGVINSAPADGLIAADIDGDGRDDLVYVKQAGDAIYWRRNETSGGAGRFAAEAVLWTLAAEQRLPASPFVESAPGFRSIVRQGDMNDDGRVDLTMQLLVPYDYCDPAVGCTRMSAKYWYVFASTGTSLVPHYGFDGNAELVLADFNADGLTDIAYTSYGQNWQLLFGMGSREGGLTWFSGPYATDAGAPASSGRTLAIDWDADGRVDLLQPTSSGEFRYCRSAGASLEACLPAGNATIAPSASPMAADVNGDGVSDVTYVGSGVRLLLHQRGPVDKLVNVTDGFGARAGFEFALFTNPSVHATGSGAVFPVRDYARPGYVVSKMTQSDGAGGLYETKYFYEGAKVHAHGRGFLGFSRRTVSESRSPLVRVEEYLQDPVYFERIGAPAKVTLQQQSGTPLARSTYTWARHSYSAGQEGRRFPYPSGISTERFELDGAGVSSVVTSNVFDTFGTLIDRTATTREVGKGLNPGAQHVERMTVGGVLNDTSYWCLGRATSTQLSRSHSLPGGTQVVRAFGESWDPVRCRRTQHVVEPSSSTLRVATSFAYDVYGNESTRTVTPIGQPGRTTVSAWINNGRFQRSTTNPEGHVTTYAWDPVLAVSTSATDANGLSTRWSYDAFNRLTRQTNPDGTSTVLTMALCGIGCPWSGAKYVLAMTRRGVGDSYVTTSDAGFDIADREVYRKEEQPGGALSLRVRRFDALGRLSQESVPDACCAAPGRWVTHTYDVLGRRTSLQRPTSQSIPTPAITRWQYDGLSVTQTDPLGHSTTRRLDAIGNILQVVDPASATTNYEYDAFRNLVKVRDFYGTETTATYDVRGFRTSMDDPDAGRSTFSHLATGELKSQSNARGQVTNFVYDRLSRITQRTEAEGTTTWTWGTSSANRNIGALAAVSSPGFQESYQYDSLGRQGAVTTAIAGATLVSRYAYDPVNGLLDTFTYPSSTGTTPLRVRQHYDRGRLVRVSNADTAATYWQLDSVNVLGRVTGETLGNGVRVASGYDAVTGLLASRAAGVGGGSSYQKLGFAWDAVGNLTARQELNRGVYEQFAYDSRDRLDYALRGGAVTLDMNYDEAGNITYKSDVGNYRYDTTRKHAVVAAGSNAYSYDASGAVVNASGTTISWLSYDLPSQLTHPAGNYSAFYYGPDRGRYRQVARAAGSLTETLYGAGGLYERITRDGSVSHRHYILAEGRRVAVQTRTTGAAPTTVYLLEDHLGGVDAFTSASGALLARTSYHPYGARRSGDWLAGSPTGGEWQQIQAITARGYTDHEHLDNLGVIHMNGRVYDPVLGRFLSPDPIVQSPYDGQGLNRYSYVRNNPWRYTDPSGLCFNTHPAADSFVQECMERVMVEASGWMQDLGWLEYRGQLASLSELVSEAGSITTFDEGDLRPTVDANGRQEEVVVVGRRLVSELVLPIDFRLLGSYFVLQSSMFDSLMSASTEFGENAVTYYIDKEEQTGNSLYRVPGLLAALWTPGTAPRTSLVLGVGSAFGRWSARPYWKYTNEGTRDFSGPWLTRGPAWSPPYGREFSQAQNALQIPRSPTGVVRVDVPTFEFVSGPRVTVMHPEWGQGGGSEYFRGLKFPE